MRIFQESYSIYTPWAKAGASFKETESSDLIIKKFADFVNDMNITKIDLLKSNIEGENFPFKHMHDINFIKNIKSIQVQPHDFNNRATKDLLEMHEILHKTHNLEKSYPFVWDFWKIKK